MRVTPVLGRNVRMGIPCLPRAFRLPVKLFGVRRQVVVRASMDPHNTSSHVDGLTVNTIVSVLGVKEIKEALRLRGLSPTGRKRDLLDRLVEAVYREIGYTPGDQGSGSQAAVAPSAALPSRPARRAASPEAAGEGSSVEGLAGPQSFEQLQSLSTNELKQLCRSYGLGTSGSKYDLAMRLVDKKADSDAPAGGAAAAAAKPGAPQATFSPGPRTNESKFVWGEKSFVDPRKMTLRELRDSLKVLGLTTTGTKPELVSRLEAALYDPAGAAAAEADRVRAPEKTARADLAASDRYVASMDWVSELGTMRVNDLRQQLESRRLSTDGTKQELIDRLAMALQAEIATPRSVEGTIQELVARLTPSEVRRELRDRGLSTGGGRTELSARLEEALLTEYRAGMWSNLEGDAAPEAAGPGLAPASPIPTMAEVLGDPDLRIGVICGGPSLERGVSLNSARSLLDHLQTAPRQPHHNQGSTPDLASAGPIGGLDVVPYYLDAGLRPWLVAQGQLYSNTPSDFDYKLRQERSEGGVGDRSRGLGSLESLGEHVKGHCHVVMPAVHGRFGEDGGLQKLLEDAGVPFVGTGSEAAAVAFNKPRCHARLQELGYPAIDSVAITAAQSDADRRARLAAWVSGRGEDPAHALLVVKPAASGSSIGVEAVEGVEQAARVAGRLLAEGVDSEVVIEPFIGEGAVEFTVIVLETDQGPVALIPTEVEIVFPDDDIREAQRALARQLGFEADGDAADDTQARPSERLFTYRRKYLPTSQVRHHLPPRLPIEAVQAIRRGAARLFKDLGLRDFARIDGWVLRDPNGNFAALAKGGPGFNGGHHEPWREVQRMDPTGTAQRLAAASTREELLAAARDHAKVWSEVTDRRMGTGPQAEAEALHKASLDAVLPDLSKMSTAGVCRPTEETAIAFTDVNIISGLEQTSFLFQQAAQVGISHAALLRHLLRRTCSRAGLPLPPCPPAEDANLTALNGLSWEELIRLLGAEEDAEDEGAAGRYEAGGANPWDDADDLRGPSSGGDGQDDSIPGAWDETEDDPQGDAGEDARFFDEYNDRDINSLGAEFRADEERAAAWDAGAAAAGATSGRVADGAAGPRRIWVLFGGESSERQVSVMSGVNVWLKLRGIPGLAVEPFLLAPPRGVGSRERSRREALLKQRNDMLAAGIPEYALPPELSLYNISTGGPAPADGEPPLERRPVWALPYPLALRHTVEEIIEASEEWSAAMQAAEHVRTDGQRDAIDLHRLVQAELSGGGVEGVAGLWSSDTREILPPARMMDFESFALEARALGATVLLSLHGGAGENGTVQAFLEHLSVPFTGSGSLASQLCMDKVETAQQLRPLEPQGISCAPKHVLGVQDLLDGAATEERAEVLFDQLRAHLGPQSSSLCIKPVGDGCSTGVARIAGGRDLRAYAAAIANGWPSIPAGALSTPHAPVEMPRPYPEVLMLEPFISTDAVVVRRDPVTGAEALEWAGRSRWVEVTIGLVGEEARMRALTPSLTVRQDGEILSLEEKFQGGTGINLTPPPESIVAPAALDGARRRAEQVATSLGLRGVARVDAFMHVDTGELVIIEANSIPGLTPSTVLMQQALSEDPPMYPAELFLRLADLATARGPLTTSMGIAGAPQGSREAGDADMLDFIDDALMSGLGPEEGEGDDAAYTGRGEDDLDPLGAPEDEEEARYGRMGMQTLSRGDGAPRTPTRGRPRGTAASRAAAGEAQAAQGAAAGDQWS